MFDIVVPDHIKKHCAQQIERYNFGKRGYADGTREQQFVGILGQSVIMELFGLGLINGATGFDSGTDFTFNDTIIDVKTMTRTTEVRDYYVNNFMAVQLKYNTDIYIFCSYNTTISLLTVCGCISKSEFMKKASFFNKGADRFRSDGSSFKTFADLYEIGNNNLHTCNSIEDLKAQIIHSFE